MFQYDVKKKVASTIISVEAVHALMLMAPSYNDGNAFEPEYAPKLGQYLLNNTSSTVTVSTLSTWPSGDGLMERMVGSSDYSPVEIELQEIQESPVRKSIFEAMVRQNGGEHAWTAQNERIYAVMNGAGEVKYFKVALL